MKIIEKPLTKDFCCRKKTNSLLDLDTKLFNKAVFKFLKTTDYPVGKLDDFPLVDNDDILVRDDIFRILEESGVGIPDYYKPIKFEVDGKICLLYTSSSGISERRGYVCIGCSDTTLRWSSSRYFRH